MSDFKVEPVGTGGSFDLVIDPVTNDYVLVGDTAETHQDAVIQRVRYECLTWLEESGFDRAEGFPWRQAVFGRQPLEGIVVFLYDRIESVEGVEGIIVPPTLELDNVPRELTIQVEIKGKDFEAEVSLIVQEPT